MLNEARIKIAEFLGTKLIDGDYLFIDYWTTIHLISGIILMILIFRFLGGMKTNRKFLFLLGILFFWEILEISSPMIKNEPKTDIIYDLIMGMGGGGIVYYFKKKQISSQ